LGTDHNLVRLLFPASACQAPPMYR